MQSTLYRSLARKTAGRFSPTSSLSSRLFGSKRGVPGNPLGTIGIYNDQEAIKGIDEEALRDTVRKISKMIG
jgi:hypothetical protein